MVLFKTNCNCKYCKNDKTCEDKSCKEEHEYNIINEAHSDIRDYPINYELYPLAKDCEEQTYELNSGEFIIIPDGWHHWVFTEPNTLAVSYTIRKIDFTDISNVYYDSMVNSKPYVGKINKNTVDYKTFFNHSLDVSFTAIFSANYKCCPVYKNYEYITFEYTSTLNDIINISNSNRLYTYIGMDIINENNILNDYNKIDFFIPNELFDMCDYNTYVWYTLNNKIDSGLHYDTTVNILYILDGKKTVRLYHPKYREKLYIKQFEYINTHISDTIIMNS